MESGRGLPHSKTWRAILTFAVLSAGLCLPAFAQFAIPWYTVDGGGGTSTGGVYSVSGTIGQPDAGGPMSGGNFSLTGGFWAMAIAIQQLGYPELNITQSGTNALISWVTSESGLLLQFTTNLATPTVWTDTGLTPVVTGGVTNTVTVPLNPAQGQFFRLRRP
jgi:hypothetical protein